MKRSIRIASIIMIICLLFQTAVFAAGGTEADPEDNDVQTSGSEWLPEPGGTWSRSCRSHPDELVTLDDIAWKNGAYSRKYAEIARADRASLGEAVPEAGVDQADPEQVDPELFPNLDTPAELPLLTIVVGFDNMPYKDGYNWVEQTCRYTNPNVTESVMTYYYNMSGEQFAFRAAWEESRYEWKGNTNIYDKKGDGIVHVRLERDHGDWYKDDAEHTIDVTRAIIAAIEASDEFVDYGRFDANGDGKIGKNELAVAVVMAGYEGSYGTYPQHGAENYLWSFAWSISSAASAYNSEYNAGITVPTPDGIAVDNYITIPEELVPGTIEPISVLAHELGHYLGLPDLYDTDYDSLEKWSAYDVGYLSVMCSGSWGWDGQKYIPGGFDAWSLCALGWTVPTTASSGGASEYNLPSWDMHETSGRVLRIDTEVEGEYYLVENRSFQERDEQGIFHSGWDRILNRKSSVENISSFYYGDYAEYGGLVFWHIDDNIYDEYAKTNEVNNSFHRPAIMPLYPQLTGSGDSFKYTFCGGFLDEESLSMPFITGDIWEERYAEDIGAYMELPLYNGCSMPYEMTASNIKIYFDTNGSDEEWQWFTVEGVKEVERIAGSNRYTTAIEAAEALKDKLWVSKFENIIIASGLDYADALAGSYLAVIKEAPILLVNSSMVPTVAQYAADNLEDGGTAYILGGIGAVPFTMDVALAGAGVKKVKRLEGKNRYLTNIAILEEAMADPDHDTEDILICYGKNYADSLSASAAGRPILLVDKALTPDQKSFLQRHVNDLNYVYAIGGTGVVTDSVASEAANQAGEFGSFTRVAGKDRYKTSVAVAEEFFGYMTFKVYLAYALNYPDGLAGGPLAYADDAPLLLVTEANHKDALNWCEETGIYECAVMGGKALISDETAREMMTR